MKRFDMSLKIYIYALILLSQLGCIELQNVPGFTGQGQTLKFNPGFNQQAPENPSFQSFKNVLTSKCLRCHDGTHQETDVNLDFSSPDELIANGWVTPDGDPNDDINNPFNDKFLKRLKKINSDPLNPNLSFLANMPMEGDLTNYEYDLIRNFLKNLKAEGVEIKRHANAFACLPNEDHEAIKIARLSRLQLRRSLENLAKGLSNSDQNQLKNDLAILWQDFPEENLGEIGYSSQDQNITKEYLEKFLEISFQYSEFIVSDAQRLQNFIGICDPNSAQCPEQFIGHFGQLTKKRPLTTAEKNTYLNFYNLPQNSYRELILSFLMSDQFILRYTRQGEIVQGIEGNNAVIKLDKYSFASEMTLTLWNSIGDSALYNLLENKSLDNPQDMEDILNYIVNHPLASDENGFAQFIAQWLKIDKDFQIHPNSPGFGHFTQDLNLNENFMNDINNEAKYMAGHYFAQGNFEDLFLNEKSFAKSQELAQIYGVSPATNSPVSHQGNQRKGILTTARFLASGGAGHVVPIYKGHKIFTRILCDELPPPPTDINTSGIPDDVSLTMREKFENFTDNSVSCYGCHSKMNPYGYTFSNYDGFGRFTEHESIYNDQNGNFIQSLQVDSKSQVDLNGHAYDVDNATQLIEKMVEYQTPQKCMSEHLLTSLFGSKLKEETYGCDMENIRQKLVDGEPLKEVAKELFRTKAFRYRKTK